MGQSLRESLAPLCLNHSGRFRAWLASAFSDSRPISPSAYDRVGWREGATNRFLHVIRTLFRCGLIAMAKLPTLTKQEEELLIWVGLCITEWAKIDYLLLRLTAQVLEVGSGRAAIVYLRTPTLGGRITLIDELITRIISASDAIDNRKTKSNAKKEWEGLARYLNELISFRNKLAHWPRVNQSLSLPSGEMSDPVPVLHFGLGDVHRAKKDLEIVCVKFCKGGQAWLGYAAWRKWVFLCSLRSFMLR